MQASPKDPLGAQEERPERDQGMERVDQDRAARHRAEAAGVRGRRSSAQVWTDRVDSGASLARTIEGSYPVETAAKADARRIRALLCAWHASCPPLGLDDVGDIHQNGGRDRGSGDPPAGPAGAAPPLNFVADALLTKLGATGVALAMLVQVMGLCLCVPRAPAPTDPHACCPRPAPQQGGSVAPASSFSMTDRTRDCCPTGLHARTVVRLNEREPLPTPAAYAVSAASFTMLADQVTPFGGATKASARTFSPPRSPVLRI